MKQALIELYGRDILKLRDEISAYKDEKAVWVTEGEISNSAGNLCLHLIGNLNHFIGAQLGNSGYVRKREEEFTLKNIPLQELLAGIDKTKEIVLNTLEAMDEKAFELDFPEKRNGVTHRNDFMLLHLLAHLNYHLGQVNYHRRLLDK